MEVWYFQVLPNTIAEPKTDGILRTYFTQSNLYMFLPCIIVLFIIILLGLDHLQLTLPNWDTESVSTLNKKLKVNWKFQFFI